MLWWGILPGCQPHSSHSCHELAVLCTPWKYLSLGCSAAGPAGLGHPRMLWGSLCQGWRVLGTHLLGSHLLGS